MNADFVRDVAPGEIIKISAQGLETDFYTNITQKKLCAMEYVYFARPDSVMHGYNVHTVRRRCGKLLAQADKGVLEADSLCVGPDSSLSPAGGFTEGMGWSFARGLC